MSHLPFAERRYLDRLSERVLVFDGAMGTSLQQMHLTAADFGGKAFEGCLDHLVLSKPAAVKSVHASFLQAGCDVIETCSFRANRLTMREYGLEGRTLELNRSAAEVARRIADSFCTADRPRFVAGSMGPSGMLPSSDDPALSAVSFDELVDVFRDQAVGLVQGGCDLLTLETAQDMLELKAAILGAQEAFRETGRRIPLQVQVTLDTTGRMLLGTDISAVLATLEHLAIDVIGLNCSTGPEHMRGPIGYLAEFSSLPLSCLPNAGLPLNVDGRAVYPLEPGPFSRELADFVLKFGVSVVGGCCGTTPAHIRQLVEAVAEIAPPRHRPQRSANVSSAMRATGLRQTPPPMFIGERLNTQGSKKMKELLLAGNYDGILEIARDQMEGGAHTLDVCVALTERADEAAQMHKVVRKLSQSVDAPLVIDTTEADVLEAALKAAPGRVIVNAINMENGRQRIDAMLPLIRQHGAAVIALTIDEQGMARTAAQKVSVAQKIHDIVVGEYGLAPDALIIDALTFTLATADPESAGAAVDTLEGIKRIKAALPGVLTSLGVSNVSYGFKPAARAVLNSVMLFHAVQAGLDMAIVNAKQITPHAEIPADQRELADDLIFCRRPDAFARFVSFFEGVSLKAVESADPTAGMTAEQRAHWRILHRKRDGIETDIDQAVERLVRESTGVADFRHKADYVCPNQDTSRAAASVLNGVLLPAMKEVGDKFGAGELILPFVLQSAEVMKKAVAHLEQYLEKTEGVSKGTAVLATVYGDVHDIGKNLVKTIVANNGYTVIDLGKQVPANLIVDRAVEVGAAAIGLSALLVSTSRQMPLVVSELHQRGLRIPVLIGGAAINRPFGRRIALVGEDEVYAGGVFYCRDAFEGLAAMDALCNPEQREESVRRVLSEARAAGRTLRSPSTTPAIVKSAVSGRRAPVPTPAVWGPRVAGRIPLESVFECLDRKALFRLSWGEKHAEGGPGDTLHAELESRLARMLDVARNEHWFAPQAVYGYWPCQSAGDDLVVYAPPAPQGPADATREIARFTFPRQNGSDHLCLADYFAPVESGLVDLVGFQVVTIGHRATEFIAALQARNEYTEAYFLHGLAVQTAEATAEYMHHHIRRELGFEASRSLRYSWGYPAMPEVADHRKLFELLPAEEALGMSLTAAAQLVPEQSTAAMVVHHPEARHFTVRARTDQ